MKSRSPLGMSLLAAMLAGLAGCATSALDLAPADFDIALQGRRGRRQSGVNRNT